MGGLVLGGFMTVGKTTVGRILAGRLGLPFVDLDERVEALAGRSLAELFAARGESAFRELEARAVQQVLTEPDSVVALGGGTLHHRGNLDALRARYPIVVLDLPWDEIEPRLGADSSRPLAGGARTLWEERQDGYARAGLRVDLTGLDPHAAAEAVLAELC